jgi:hypothetical protein
VSSLRFSVEGTTLGTVAGSSGSVIWNTSGLAATDYTIRVDAADAVAGYIKSATETFLLTAGAPPSPPDVSCSVNSFNLFPGSPQAPGTNVTISGSGSCNTGVRAIRISIDGSHVYEIGASSVSWPWNTSSWAAGDHYVLFEVAGLGDDNWSQAASSATIYTLNSSIPAPSPVVNSFQTGDIIQIGYDVFVIIEGQRCLVPNPETLDALGISRDQIDNKGFSDNELGTIPRGADIPDVERDRAEFDDFKNRYFPDADPIMPPLDFDPGSDTERCEGIIASILCAIVPEAIAAEPSSEGEQGDQEDCGLEECNWWDLVCRIRNWFTPRPCSPTLDAPSDGNPPSPITSSLDDRINNWLNPYGFVLGDTVCYPDGLFCGECVSLAKRLSPGLPGSRGQAGNYYDAYKDDMTALAANPLAAEQGDLLVWPNDHPQAGSGHIAVVFGWDGFQLIIVEQNWPLGSPVRRRAIVDYTGIYLWKRH